ncbi:MULTISPECIES: hypothetical protein [Kitasatospora]|uniref:Hydrolase n=1 Tax=Kitasatospora setae (strain ATCC 33774 / DSM 43861 / JCM 3304 / KCC A-0304 / NBRC 14216 / KM-6054) TaxID=452652 RepID=E4N5G6_KITSK|nr:MULTISPECIES: hypothetical protein [Kitasatospora]BAJ26447.1 hypothetical protein KSE_06050 [Kitasatospora setae KM-6054]
MFVSGEIRHATPHPAFFAAVERALGPDRTVCCVIGDSRTADLAPAAARSWPAVHVCGPDTPCPPGDPAGPAAPVRHAPGPGAVLLPCAHS